MEANSTVCPKGAPHHARQIDREKLLPCNADAHRSVQGVFREPSTLEPKVIEKCPIADGAGCIGEQVNLW